MLKYILAHDLGTSSDKAILCTTKGEIVGITKRDYPMVHLKPGYAEQNPEDWWTAVCETSSEVLQKTSVAASDVVGLTFSAQNQCLIPVDKDGKPLTPAMSWLDARSIEIMRSRLWTQPRVMGYNIFKVLKFLRITGGSPGQTGKDQIGKILWLRENQPEIFHNVHKYLDAKDYIIFQLTGKFVTSVDIAVIWWMLDTRKNVNKWHPELCRIAGISPDQLAEVKPAAEIAGTLTSEAAEKLGLLEGTPVINGAGDLAAAALGSAAIDEGELHISLGTSGWVGGHYQKRRIDIPHYTGCIGSTNPSKYYLAMAHQETAGVCLEWLKNKILYHEEMLKEETKVSEIYQILDALAETVAPGAEGLMFTPWMFGERCPLDDDLVRAGLFNLSLNHSREHIIRAVFEGIAFNTRWAMETLENLYKPVTELNMIGGGAKSDIWCQIFADILNRKINRVSNPQQAGARGVALLASMRLGYLKDYQDIKNQITINRQFSPNPEYRQLYDRLFGEFKNIYKHNRKWYARMNHGR